MPTRLCAEPGCPNPAAYRGRCATCARVNERRTERAGRHVYGTRRWVMLRRSVLFERPLCACGAIATDVHHKHDIADGGDPWDPANLEALCHPCHSRITRRRL